MNCSVRMVLVLSIVLAIPGCTRLIDWANQHFNQGGSLSTNEAMIQNYFKTVRIYDQLRTRAIFDVLWLAKPVVDAHTSFITFKYCKPCDEYEKLLEENERATSQTISFYVLSLYEISLSLTDSPWALVLQVDCGPCIAPIEVKNIELLAEWRDFFGKRHTRFKRAYKVTFYALDEHNQHVITPESSYLRLYIRNYDKQAVVTWPIYSNFICSEELSACTTVCQ